MHTHTRRGWRWGRALLLAGGVALVALVALLLGFGAGRGSAMRDIREARVGPPPGLVAAARAERAEQAERVERAERGAQAERGERSAQAERGERGDWAERDGWMGERGERGERGWMGERGERQGHRHHRDGFGGFWPLMILGSLLQFALGLALIGAGVWFIRRNREPATDTPPTPPTDGPDTPPAPPTDGPTSGPDAPPDQNNPPTM